MFSVKSVVTVVTLLALITCLWVPPASVSAGQAARATGQTVRFKAGVPSVTYTGRVQSYDSKRYELTGKAGQKLSVQLVSKNRFLYFNVLSGRTNLALETTPPAREVTRWSGTLPEDGRYVVQVYLVRAEARRKRKADFKLIFTQGNSTPTKSVPPPR